jgi:hypothetical protein
VITAILVVWLAGGGAGAEVALSDSGDVLIWRADQQRWSSVYRCHDAERMSSKRLAWSGTDLYIACPGEVVARWHPGLLGALPTTNLTLAARRPKILGSGQRSLFFVELGAVWRCRSSVDLVERIAGAPEWPLRSVEETPLGLVVCGQHRWLWRRGGWTRVSNETNRGDQSFDQIRKRNSSTRFSQRYQGL